MSKLNLLKKLNLQKGFIKSEKLVILFIIITLALITFLAMIPSEGKARVRDIRRVADISSLRRVLKLYYADYGKYPEQNTWCSVEATCKTLQEELEPYMDGIPGDPLFGDNEGEKIFSYQYVSTPYGLGYKIHTDLETGDKYEVWGGDGFFLAYGSKEDEEYDQYTEFQESDYYKEIKERIAEITDYQGSGLSFEEYSGYEAIGGSEVAEESTGGASGPGEESSESSSGGSTGGDGGDYEPDIDYLESQDYYEEGAEEGGVSSEEETEEDAEENAGEDSYEEEIVYGGDDTTTEGEDVGTEEDEEREEREEEEEGDTATSSDDGTDEGFAIEGGGDTGAGGDEGDTFFDEEGDTSSGKGDPDRSDDDDSHLK